MDINICNKGLACSTIMLGNFGSDLNDPWTNKSFAIDLYESLLEASKPNDDHYWETDEDHLYSHDWKTFAFVTASTNTDYQKTTEEVLEVLGFVGTEPTYNEKNGTHVRFWITQVSKLIDQFNKMNL